MTANYRKPEATAKFKALYTYDPETGIITGPKGPRPTQPTTGQRYPNTAIHINDKKIMVKNHQLAYFLMTGDWAPEHLEMDHINGNRTDNRWENLRVVDKITNVRNSIQSHTLEYPGIRPKNAKFSATLRIGSLDGNKMYSGPCRDTQAEAWLDRVELFKEHGQLNDRQMEIAEYMPKAMAELITLNTGDE